MFFKHMVPRIYLIFIRWVLRMQIHMIFRMCRVITSVQLHLVKGKPALARLAQMADQRNSFTDEVIDYRIEPRIIDHYKPAVLVAEFHADVLPYLDCRRTIPE